ncbi:hypothetical protein A2U01_0047366, partial [Trifolium medium]|nr:hypothetical protein [Trifolium medium]
RDGGLQRIEKKLQVEPDVILKKRGVYVVSKIAGQVANGWESKHGILSSQNSLAKEKE